MGLNTWAAFAGTDADAMVAGDVAMLDHEVTPVLTPNVSPSHTSSGDAFKAAAIAAARRFQPAISSRSRRRPAAVTV